MNSSIRALFSLLCVVLACCPPALSQVPQLMNYQGRVAVNNVNFDGGGQFKFALVNGDGTTTYWSNDGTSTAGSQPSAAVSLTVTKGLYSVLLGDATLPNMQIIPNSVFDNGDVRLRVWFNDGVHGFQWLAPDQRVAAVGYAIMAATAQTVPDGAITTAKLAANAVGNAQLQDGSVTAAKITGPLATSQVPSLDAAKITSGTFILGRIPVLDASRIPVLDASKIPSLDSSKITTGTFNPNLIPVLDGDKLAPAVVTTDKIAGNAVTESGLANDAVTTLKIANDAVTTLKIANDAVTTLKIANDAVTTLKIANDAVTTLKIANDAVTTLKIANDAVTTEKIVDAAVTSPKLADGAVTSSKLGDAAVTSSKIADGAVTASKIPDGSITEAKLGFVPGGGNSAGVPNGMVVFTSSGAFTIPAGVTKILVEVAGGGGGGGGGFDTYPGGDGGDGGFSKVLFVVNPGDVVSTIVGTGGAPGINSVGPMGTSSSGYNGGTSQVFVNGNELSSAYGGGGGWRAGVFGSPMVQDGLRGTDGSYGGIGQFGRSGGNAGSGGRGGLQTASPDPGDGGYVIIYY